MENNPRGSGAGRPDQQSDDRVARSWGKYAGVGIQFAASIVLFLYAGRWVDARFGTDPWGVIIGVFTGASAAFYSMYSSLMADLRREEAAKKAP
jgi:F0F1-type ATP synthase assembly protein I